MHILLLSILIMLQEELDRKLAERQARETGICPVREHLYRQSFGKLRKNAYAKNTNKRGSSHLLRVDTILLKKEMAMFSCLMPILHLQKTLLQSDDR